MLHLVRHFFISTINITYSLKVFAHVYVIISLEMLTHHYSTIGVQNKVSARQLSTQSYVAAILNYHQHVTLYRE